ncbi:MAG: ATPase [Bacteroidia bacterium]|nr:ATPase [Bacteroidia bacterium]
MKIAVLSGKGGTGKTLLAVNLTAVARSATYIDCDVEEPNGYLFFKPRIIHEEAVTVKTPYIISSLCKGSRDCIAFCRFHALAYINGKVTVFEDLCHSCGGCAIVCPNKAIQEKDRVIGKIQKGDSEGITVLTGILNPGEPSGVPIVKKILSDAPEGLSIVDCPPGTSCIVMESIKDVDYCLLVAEPTIFGAHNLAMAHELVKLFNKPYGVVLNKTVDEDNPSKNYCLANKIDIIAEIPFDKHLGDLNSNGIIVARAEDRYSQVFSSILARVRERLDK